MARLILSILIAAATASAAPTLARPPKGGILAYAGPLWQAWRESKRAGTLTVRLHTGSLQREVTLPKGHLFLLLLGDGTVVTTPANRKYVTLLKPGGKRIDHAPYVWKKVTRLVEAYRDGIVVQRDSLGTGHLFFVPWDRGELKRDKRVRLTKEEVLVEPKPRVIRHGSNLYFAGERFNLATKQRETFVFDTDEQEFLFDGKHIADARTGLLLRVDTLYFVRPTANGVELASRPRGTTNAKRLGDFRIPERDPGESVRGGNCVSFKPNLRGWRHVRWDREGLVYWNGKQWTRIAWPPRPPKKS